MVKQVKETKQKFPDVTEVFENFEYDLKYNEFKQLSDIER